MKEPVDSHIKQVSNMELEMLSKHFQMENLNQMKFETIKIRIAPIKFRDYGCKAEILYENYQNFF